MEVEDDDPTLGDKFSTATLQHGGGHGAIPSAVHGAPSSAAESREVLARLKRMAGFESQDFDPAVQCFFIAVHLPAAAILRCMHACDTPDALRLLCSTL